MRYLRTALITGAVVTGLWMFHRVLLSSWCDEPTLLPASVCGIHPKRWISKGSGNLFRHPHTAQPPGEAVSLESSTDGPEIPGDEKEADLPTASSETGHQARPGRKELPERVPPADSPAAAQPPAADEGNSKPAQPEERGAAEEPAAAQALPADKGSVVGSGDADSFEGSPRSAVRDDAGAQSGDHGSEDISGDDSSSRDGNGASEPDSEEQTWADDGGDNAGKSSQEKASAQVSSTEDSSGDGSGSTTDDAETSDKSTVNQWGRLPPVTEHVGDQEVMWEKPADGEPVGVFLLLNGCNHGADGWWDPQPACPHCLGLPEEKAILREGLRRGHVVMALSVVQQASKMRCWASSKLPNANLDMISTVTSVETIMEREGWGHLPIYGWGGSAGGTFVARLPYFLNVKGIMVQLKATSAEEMLQPELQLAANEVPLRGGEQGWSYPRIVYAFNRRDPVATERALAFTGALKQLGREAVLVGADPMPLDDHFFSRRIPRFSPEVSRQLVAALRGGGFLDEHNYIKDDPRRTDKKWVPLVRREVPALKNAELRKFVSPVFEELNWAFSNHQGISDTTAKSFDLFEGGKGPEHDMLWNPQWWHLQGAKPTDGTTLPPPDPAQQAGMANQSTEQAEGGDEGLATEAEDAAADSRHRETESSGGADGG